MPTETKAKHTQWRTELRDDARIELYDPKGEIVAFVNYRFNDKLRRVPNEEYAALIVRAVNSHKALVEALKLALRYLTKAQADGMNTVVPVSRAVSIAEAALALAKEGE